jgi:hypothetical protein
MSRSSCSLLRTALSLFVVGMLALAADVAWGDDVRPVQVQLREQEPGRFLVQWQVPQLLPPEAMPTPRLPDSCVAEGERTIQEQPGSWLNRQVFRCSDGLSGQEITIDYPFGNPSLSTVLRIELLSGERHAPLLAPTEATWQVPPAAAVDAPLREAQGAVLEGMGHVFETGVDLLFLAVVLALGSLTLITVFGLGQLGAVALSAAGVGIDAPLGEIGLALATLLLAREALRPEQERSMLAPLVVVVGVVHGLGWVRTAEGSGAAILGVLGMDVTLVALAWAGAKLIVASAGLPRTFAYAGGVGAVAVGLAVWSMGAAVSAESSAAASGALPGLGGGGTRAQASRRVSPQSPDATIQSFVAVEAFEVRNEVLVRLGDVASEIELVGVDTIGVEEQPAVKTRVAELVNSRQLLEVDGDAVTSRVERIDFMTVDLQGVLPRPTPVPEPVDRAYVGVTLVHITPSTAQSVAFTWTDFDMVPEMPGTVIDPEVSRAALLTAESPTLRWVNELAEDPVPTVSAVAVEPVRVPVPLLSFVVLAALALLAVSLRRKGAAWPIGLARVALAVAVLLGPVADVAVALPLGSAPSEGQARRILAGILPNVYRAFEYREESAAYDRLAVSITGPTLTDIYLEHRRALEMEERGGARARVEAVEVLDVPSVSPAPDGGFDAQASWTVSGTVTHFGHRHFRQNRYDARVVVVPVADSWRIRSIDILDEERVQ